MLIPQTLLYDAAAHADSEIAARHAPGESLLQDIVIFSPEDLLNKKVLRATWHCIGLDDGTDCRSSESWQTVSLRTFDLVMDTMISEFGTERKRVMLTAEVMRRNMKWIDAAFMATISLTADFSTYRFRHECRLWISCAMLHIPRLVLISISNNNRRWHFQD